MTQSILPNFASNQSLLDNLEVDNPNELLSTRGRLAVALILSERLLVGINTATLNTLKDDPYVKECESLVLRDYEDVIHKINFVLSDLGYEAAPLGTILEDLENVPSKS